MSGIFQATSRQPAPRRHQSLTAIGAAIIITGLTVLACGIVLAGDFVTVWQEGPPKADIEMSPNPPPASEAEATVSVESPEIPADWVRHEAMGVSFSAPESFGAALPPDETDQTEIILIRAIHPDGRFLTTTEEVQTLDEDTQDLLHIHAIRLVLESERAIEREMPDLITCPIRVLPGGQQFHDCLVEEIEDGAEIVGRALVSTARDARGRGINLTIGARKLLDAPAWDTQALLVEFERIVATVEMVPHPAFVPKEEAPASGFLGGLMTLDYPRDRLGVVIDLADNWLAMGMNGFVGISTGDPARRGLQDPMTSFAAVPEVSEARYFGLDARLLLGPVSPELLARGTLALIVPDICLPGDAPLVISVAAPRDFREVELYRDVVESIRLNLPADVYPCRPAIAGQPNDIALPETAPAGESPAYESRAGLAIDLPLALRVLLDDHDGVILSEGPELAQHQGLYVGLFFGDETKFTRFGPDQGWINDVEDSFTLTDGTQMRRMALTLDPAHGSGQGLILMRDEADAQGNAIAAILVADRPDIDPHELARSLRLVTSDAVDYYGVLPPEAPEGWVRQVRAGLSFALPPDFERVFSDDSELGMARADDLSLLEAPPPGFESTFVGVQLLSPHEVEQEFMPVIERSEVMVPGEHLFFRRDMAMEQEGMKLRAVMLHSDAGDRRDRHLALMFVASNPADEAEALAEFETVLSTLRMHPSRHFEMPITEMSALDELFHVTLPRGWQSHFSGRGYRLFASGNDIAVLQSGIAAHAALEMPHAGFAEPPEISDGNFLGLPGQIARGRASQSVHISGGQMTMVVFDRCLPDGGPIMVTVAGSRHWEESDSLRAFVEGLRINLPEDSITCRPELGIAVVETGPALEPPTAPELEPVPSVKTYPLFGPDEVAPWDLHERVTVRVLRAWGQLPPRFDRLALQLRAHDIDLWDLELADIRQLASDAASADTPWADFAQELEELARHMAELTDTE